MSCDKHNQCMNNTLCNVCVDGSLLKEKKQYKKPTKYKQRLGSAFEKKVVKQHNSSMAKETLNSGSFWMDKGDIKTDTMLIEAKDRGSKKQVTIHREWLEKISDEALSVNKLPVLTFQFKEDSKIYAIIEFEDLMSLKKGNDDGSSR
jgi:hypothetical protein